HHARLGPGAAGGLGNNPGADASVAGQALPGEMELIAAAPDVRPATLDRPGAAIHRLASSRGRIPQIGAAPTIGTIRDWRRRWRRAHVDTVKRDGAEGAGTVGGHRQALQQRTAEAQADARARNGIPS